MKPVTRFFGQILVKFTPPELRSFGKEPLGNILAFYHLSALQSSWGFHWWEETIPKDTSQRNMQNSAKAKPESDSDSFSELQKQWGKQSLPSKSSKITLILRTAETHSFLWSLTLFKRDLGIFSSAFPLVFLNTFSVKLKMKMFSNSMSSKVLLELVPNLPWGSWDAFCAIHRLRKR